MRVRGEYQAHIQLTNNQYNLPSFEKKLERKNNRTGMTEGFSAPDECALERCDSIHAWIV